MLKHPYISIAGRRIAADVPPYIIAELSANHNGQLDTAMKIVQEAKKAGADAIKLQTYTPDTITLDSNAEEFKIHGGLWDGKTLYQLYEEAHMPWEWHRPLFASARKLGITMFSSPFDNTAVDLLEDLNAPAYKIASFEAIDLSLIKYVAGTGKPIIISTGMADAEEIMEAIEAAREGGCKELAILHCVSGYPAPAADYNLSDHTLDNTTAIASVALGACIIEKHFTLDRRSGGPDDSFSIEPAELANLCNDTKTAWESLGAVNFARKASEQANAKFRRSLYVVQHVKKGEVFNETNVRSVRPGYGLAPKHLARIVGKHAAREIPKASPMTWDMVE
jgi:pseudaminic acid synthase